ncbi:FAD-dependent monooxygenase OpS4 [Colletotrichum fructicola]|uniref:FAD-dependent monooxygenase OpS4 n=2 Tax=Colletotrichum fructicola (strain Nara gc5) TaxID=1213859 RepID=A0A7J6IDI8_COLFN|nr:FAD-dependent monooxygenase [Colletotrichum fructicola]KAF4473913.1 FAD-dependent monooxygenase OpS4 [Colletotrichum fructicola Nara gc5]KAE9574495.1 FAD-dependent monooxygenase [Colletotrichum fructicola]KAF4898801.1 FAD-dependent monooxygenase OpS4 [Colletotrichum fructicola]KAF4911294.1 FAD-dependent monooxygenase OpS4 [Colletotrichum fructicola]KAF4929694.1 FAD-dependent monooxygenase OpS4 [Colletotrichum fructicola]
MASPMSLENDFHVIIVGAGLAGLSAALSIKLANTSHRVTIFESAKELREVGAGIQLTPNGVRLLEKWDVMKELPTALPDTMSVRRYDGSRLLAHEPFLQQLLQRRCGASIIDVHRADLQNAMLAKCVDELGVTIKLGTSVKSVEFNDAAVTLENGSIIHGDVVLLADGLWSTIRSEFAGKDHPPIATGDLAYRLLISVDELSGPDKDELREFISRPALNFWIGPSSHVVGYSLREGTMFNLVFLRPDDLPGGVSRTGGTQAEISSALPWDPLLLKFLRASKEVTKWKLMWAKPLSQLANDSGTFFMAGDCCHPMLPYLAQGANSSLEDGAVLGHLLGKVSQANKTKLLPVVAKVYQRLRNDRTRWIQEEAFRQRDELHLSDGEEQRERDRYMVGQLGAEIRGPFPIRFFCPEAQRWLFAYDAYEQAERGWDNESSTLC